MKLMYKEQILGCIKHVCRYVEELRTRLMNELEADTIVNIEF